MSSTPWTLIGRRPAVLKPNASKEKNLARLNTQKVNACAMEAEDGVQDAMERKIFLRNF